MYRTHEAGIMDETIETSKVKQRQLTARMKGYYDQEGRVWQDAKKEREEAFEFCRSRQGDNSQAIK